MAKFDVSNRLYVVIWVFILPVIVFAVIAALDYYSYIEGDYAREITVDGSGSAFVVPDTASVSFGVYSEGDTVDEVVADNAERMTQVKKVLKENGISEENIKTTGYYLDQNYTWTQEGGSVADGYYLDETIKVTFDDFNAVSDVLSAVAEAGVDMVGGVQFEVEDVEEAYSLAREQAVENAKKKAEEIAKTSGLKLGDVVNYWEWEDYYYDDYYYDEYAYAYEEEALGSSLLDASVGNQQQGFAPELSPGEEKITLSVSLTYRIK